MIYSSCTPGWMPKDRVVLMTMVSVCYMIYSFRFTYISLLTGQIYSAVLRDYHGSRSLWHVYHFTLGFLLSVHNAFACYFFIQLEMKLRPPQQSWFLRDYIQNCYCSHNKFLEYSISMKPRMLFPMIYLVVD